MSKNKLEYETNEPAFLRRLRGEVAGSQSDVDRHERPTARPRLSKKDEEDDGPTYVVEGSGDTMSKADYEAMVAKQTNGDVVEEKVEGVSKDTEDQSLEHETTGGSKSEPVTVGTATKKRKAGRVVGLVDSEAPAQTHASEEAPKKKARKKAKAVKLSFGDE
jgi:hypothetical protein